MTSWREVFERTYRSPASPTQEREEERAAIQQMNATTAAMIRRFFLVAEAA
jgi:hypothetical protein